MPVGSPTELTVERRLAPIGIDEPRPRLSWRPALAPSMAQAAYQVQVADEPAFGGAPETLLWDSGRVASRLSTLVDYAGPALVSGQRVRWRVRTWPTGDPYRASPWSAWSAWEMGLLAPADWIGRWIGHRALDRRQGPEHEDYIAPGGILRRDVRLPATPRRARLYITALGVYEARVNGARVGDRRLSPGWTDYARRIEYQTYDLTDHLHAGTNTLVVAIGEGQKAAVASLRRLGLRVEVVPSQTFDDVFASIHRMGALLGRAAAAKRLAADLARRIDRVRRTVAALPAGRRPRVFYEVWDRPLMTAAATP